MPGWTADFLASRTQSLVTVEQRMALAVALAAENVRRGSGGPFGALVIDETDLRVLGWGVNCVLASGLSVAHAEILALSTAQAAVGDWNLGAQGPVQLVTTCEPCAMCFGAIPWSGVTSLAWGAHKADAEAAGFDEGDKPADWERSLEARGIRMLGGVLRAEAAEVLAAYAREDGAIYHPTRENKQE